MNPKTMVDGSGNAIPVKYVKPYDRKRDKIARRIEQRFDRGRELIRRIYEDTLADIDELVQAAGADGLVLGGTKGNVQFQSFDRLIQVGIEARYNVEKKAIEKEAKHLEHERDINRAKDPYFDYAEVLLQIAIVMSSIAILAHSRRIFIFAVVAASLGTLLAVNGFWMVVNLPFFGH